MTLTELNALDPIVQKYTAFGWEMHPCAVLPPQGTSIGQKEHAYQVKSPRMQSYAVISYCFDETQLNAFECLSVARQNHEKTVMTALYDVKEDMLKELAAVYGLTSKGTQVPSEIVVKELRIPLFS